MKTLIIVIMIFTFTQVQEPTQAFAQDRDIIATVVYNESWYQCSDRHRELVAGVIVNRVNSDLFPGTVYEVVTQNSIINGRRIYQYHPDYADPDSYYSQRAREDEEAWATCQEIATRALRGEIEIDPDVVYQSEFILGSGIYEEHYTPYSVTYFCYA